jgi:N4-gp56 family major capsid protein
MGSQVWAVASLGGYMYTDELTNVMRTALQPIVRFRQFCDAKDATDKGLGKGDLFHWNVYSNVASGGGQLDESEAMPETNFTITQGTLTIREYGNSVPYSGKLDNLSKQPVAEIIHKVLKNDAKKSLDGAAMSQFDLTNVTVTPTGGNSATAVTFETGGCTITNNVAFNKDHCKAIVDGMKEREVAPYMNDDYFALAWPTTFRTLKNGLEAIHQYTETGFTKIMNGEIGRYENVRFCEQTNVAKGGAVDSATWTFRVADAWNNGLSDWIFFFGADTVAEALAIPEEIRGAIPQDYGRKRGVAWYYLGGFGIVHGPAGDALQTRIFKWESAT